MSEAEQPHPDLVVTAGGDPTPEQLAALVIALTPVHLDDEEPDRDDGLRGWSRAALIEGVGGRHSASLPDLVQGRFGLGHVGDPGRS